MNTKWLVETNGDPLGVIQKIFIDSWEGFNLDTMVVPANGESASHLIHKPDDLNRVNPFKPLMTTNTAKYLPQILKEQPSARVGVLLRPCEARALEAKTKRAKIPLERVLTICVDCLGTYTVEDYQWRARRKSPESLAGEALNFARQGGIAAYRFRSACQACRTPIGNGADINIGVIGLPVRQKILVEVHDQATAENLGMEKTTSPEDQSHFDQRQYIAARTLQRATQTRQRLIDSLESVLPGDVDALISQFKRCGECRSCFESCPLCSAEYPAKNKAGLYERDQVMGWMISCAGCGMCEQACPNHLPLVTIFANIRQQLIELTEGTQVH